MRSLWLEEALACSGEEDLPALEGTLRTDVCIVGGGYAGLWTAVRLIELDPALDVTILEADICGGGASGRNGGFVLSWWAKFSSLKKLSGTDEALRLARASAEAVAEVGRFCEAHAIDAHYRPDGWLWVATSPAQVGAWEETIVDIERAGHQPFRRLEPEDVWRRTGSRAHLAGVFEETAATVQPALLARGLRRVAREKGVRIFERTPMRALERSRPPRIRTPRGTVTAEKVVLTMNAWSASLPDFRRTLLVLASDIVATEPVPGRLSQLGWTDGLCVSDSRMLVNYYRTTRDGRMVWGKGGCALVFGGRIGTSLDGPAPRAEAVAASMRAIYPSLADAKITHSWTGPIDRTPTGLPYLGRLEGRDDLLYGYGFSGNGVGPTVVAGRVLASRVLGRDDEWAAVNLPERPSGRFPRDRTGFFPPEPFLFIGGLVVRAAVARKERAEDQGRRPGRATLALASLAPAGLVPLKEVETRSPQ